MNEIEYYNHAEASAEAEYVSHLERERDKMLAALKALGEGESAFAALLREGYAEQLDAARTAIAKAEPQKVPSIHDFDPPF